MKFDIIKELENELSKVSIKDRVRTTIYDNGVEYFMEDYINDVGIDNKKLDDYIMCNASRDRLTDLFHTLEQLNQDKSDELSIKNDLYSNSLDVVKEIIFNHHKDENKIKEIREFLKMYRPSYANIIDKVLLDIKKENEKEEESGKFYKIECEYDLKCDDKIFHGKVKAIEYAKAELSKLGQNYNDVDEMNLIGYVELTVE